MSDALVFLRDSSDSVLQAYELAKRNEAANLMKEQRELAWKIASALAEANMARLVRELRQLEARKPDLPALDLLAD